MPDKIIRGNSIDGSIRIFVADTTQLVNKAQQFHATYPIATAALGRALTAVSMMGAMQKGEKDLISIQIKGDGELGLVSAISDSSSKVKGYVGKPHVQRPLNSKGKLDVGGAIGSGTLYVIRDLGMKEPYIGQTPLVNGEIAEDLTYYYASSEQVPTAIGLGVLVDVDGSVIHSGGFLLQLMPEADELTAEKLEDVIKALPSITDMMKVGLSCDDILLKVTEGFSVVMQNQCIFPQYFCDCTEKRVEKALISIGKEELTQIIEEDGKAEMVCQFCSKKYEFGKGDLAGLLKSALK